MAFPVTIRDPASGVGQAVTGNGESVGSAISPNDSQYWEMSSIGTPYVFAPPVAGKRMRLMNVLMYGNKGIGTNDATVDIYTSIDPTATSGTTVIQFELPKYASRDLIGLNLELPEGVYLLATTNDATVFLTMMGYYSNT